MARRRLRSAVPGSESLVTDSLVMQQRLLKIIRFLERVPVVGVVVSGGIRLGKALYSRVTLHALCMDMQRKIALLETCQLPALLENLSRINHAVLVLDKRRDTSRKSVSGALRKLLRKVETDTRLLEDLRRQLQEHVAVAPGGKFRPVRLLCGRPGVCRGVSGGLRRPRFRAGRPAAPRRRALHPGRRRGGPRRP